MKKALLTLPVIFICMAALSQNIPPVDGVRMETAQDYQNADSLVVQVSRYLLSIPLNQDNHTRLRAGVFLTRWMQGSPQFNVTPNENVMKYIGTDVDLLSVYYAALCSFVLQYPSVKESNTVTLNAAKELVAYMNKSSNHVILTRRFKKLCDADDKGELKSFLKL